MAINLLLVDDDELTRTSLKIILDMDPDINVMGLCSNGDEAYKKVKELPEIDIILMDIRMPVCDGVVATKKIMEIKPQTKIIILTTFDDDEYIFEALKNGAKGYMLKNVSPDKIIEAVKVVYHGNLLIHQDISNKLSSMLQRGNDVSFQGYNLTDTEMSIIKLLADGYTNKEIAEKIFLSEGTVKNKISDILSKLNLRDRTQIAIFYLKGGKLETSV